MGRPGYPAEFRRKVLDLLAEGRSVASVAHDLDVSDQTIYNWRRQERIDRGEQTDHELGQGVVIGVPDRPDRRTDAGLGEASSRYGTLTLLLTARSSVDPG